MTLTITQDGVWLCSVLAVCATILTIFVLGNLLEKPKIEVNVGEKK